MNKKGFTLVELLAVITLLAILSGLAIPNVISSINNSRKNSFLLDAKRMVSKAEGLISSSSSDRNEAKNHGIVYHFSDLNEKREFTTDADGGSFSQDTFVSVSVSGNTYQYCVCIIGSKRKVTGSNKTCSTLNTTPGVGCLLSTNLTSINVVSD